jgi:hypothetical protein
MVVLEFKDITTFNVGAEVQGEEVRVRLVEDKLVCLL